MKLIEAAKRKRLLNIIIDISAICLLFEFSFWLEEIMLNKLPMQLFRIVILAGGYYVPLEYFFGKTVGKFITGTSVVDRAGNKIDISTTLQRYFARWLPFEFASLGLGRDAKAWHDTLSKTYVIDDVLNTLDDRSPSDLSDDHLAAW